MRRLIGRKLLPLYGILVVLVLAFTTPLPTLAKGGGGDWRHEGQNNSFGHNNCGVKGDGQHDHGKECPNYPFPGHGTDR